jgi:Uncharacterised protein family (UPF0158)
LRNPIKLQKIIEELEIQFDESRTFLNVKTGEIVSVTSEELRAAEEDEPFDHLPEWQQEDRRVANDVFENFENYIELPTKYDVNEYEIMEDFCLSISEQRKRKTLLKAIKGKGAFRRFKEEIIEFEIEEQWYSFRNDRFKEIVIEWCLENNINFLE